MVLLSKPSSAARTALIYITAGALIDVWTGIWLWWMGQHPPANDSTYFWAYGFLLTGATLLVIGFGLGRIGRAARHAELPPEEVTDAIKRVEQDAAARAPLAVPAADPAVLRASVPATPVLSTPPVAQPVASTNAVGGRRS
jgi:hypothetical protein